jgi:hypothetical protein
MICNFISLTSLAYCTSLAEAEKVNYYFFLLNLVSISITCIDLSSKIELKLQIEQLLLIYVSVFFTTYLCLLMSIPATHISLSFKMHPSYKLKNYSSSLQQLLCSNLSFDFGFSIIRSNADC